MFNFTEIFESSASNWCFYKITNQTQQKWNETSSSLEGKCTTITKVSGITYHDTWSVFIKQNVKNLILYFKTNMQ